VGQPLLRRAARGRIEQILREHGLTDAPLPEDRVTRVASANDDDARDALRRLSPAVVVVNGTRILGRRTLEALSCPIINTHAGITPLYRGVHGAYWALAEGRPELAGTTVHYVDKGIDTGPVIAQATFRVSPRDNLGSYPYLHTAAGAPILVDAVRRALDGTLAPAENLPQLPSVLRYHPTLWGYLYARLRRGVR
jgi:folate-dependent phosphoribosylglycinamide formyltransferase PurN